MRNNIPSAKEARHIIDNEEAYLIVSIEKGIRKSVEDRNTNFGIKIPKKINKTDIKDFLHELLTLGYGVSIKRLSDGFDFLIVEW